MIGTTNPDNGAREACRQGDEGASANFEQGEYFGGTAYRTHRETAPSWKRQDRRPGGRQGRRGGKGHS
jgi:hypothetical protein